MPEWWTEKDIDPFQSFKKFKSRTDIGFEKLKNTLPGFKRKPSASIDKKTDEESGKKDETTDFIIKHILKDEIYASIVSSESGDDKPATDKQAALKDDESSGVIPDLTSLNRFKLTGKSPITAMFEDQELEDTAPYLIHTLFYTDNDQVVNDPNSEVTRGRDNWLVDGFSDAEAYAKVTPYRRPVLINNLFDDANDGDDLADDER